MICGRCDQPIRPGEPYEEIDNPGASAAGSTIYRHIAPCRRVPTQTSPVRH